MASHTHWLFSVPNDTPSVDSCLDKMASATIVKSKGAAEISWFKVPLNLKVGTLDSLMTLMDELQRMEASVESVLKKVERQVAETHSASVEFARQHQRSSAPGSSRGAGGSRGRGAAAVPPAPSLLVDGLTVDSYLRSFSWNAERFDPDQSLPELSSYMVGLVDKADADLRAYINLFQEKKTTHAAMARKQTGNLMVVSLEDVITPKVVEEAGAEFLDTEYLITQVIVLPKSNEEVFLSIYETLDNQSVPYGPPEDRESIRGSPVVPRSACRLTEDADGYVLYTVVVLKKFLDSFRAAARAKRLTVRDFTYCPSTAGSGSAKLAKLELDMQESLTQLQDQCVRKFSEVFSIWIYLKAIRVFVESVLRFGLPINFVCALMKPARGSESALKEALTSAYSHLEGGFLADGPDGTAPRSDAELGLAGDQEFVPFVLLPFAAPGSTQKR